MTNKCTLLIDGNWLMISRVSIFMKSFEKSNSEIARQQTASEFKELLARSINVILNRFPIIDNIVLISDGGSWRKQVPIPSCLSDITYKGNRSQEKEFDWNLIYKTFNDLINSCKENGITTSCYSNAEGDDWVWYWSRRLNSEGINTIIWSSDNDLKQLIQTDKNTNAFTAWYNDKNGLWLSNDLNTSSINPLDFFMNPEYISPVLESIKTKSKTVNYIDPYDIILNKIICGDAGDNIMSVARVKSNNRIYKVTDKEWTNISNKLNVHNINDLKTYKDDIINSILNIKRYKGAISKQSISDMIDYNIQLVWLNEAVIPEPVIMAMNQIEYKIVDVQYFKSNYKVLLGEKEQQDILDIFESI